MSGHLPPVDPVVTAGVLELLPRRLRDRLPETIGASATWQVDIVDNSTLVRVGDATVTLATGRDGAVAHTVDAVCDCLLAPRCLHLAAVLSAAPLSESPSGDLDDIPSEVDDSDRQEEVVNAQEPAVTTMERRAADGLWRALGQMLEAGAEHAGSVETAALLRAVHVARAAKLHRAADAGSRVAEITRRLSVGDPGFDRDELVAALRSALLAAYLVRTRPTIDAEVRGQARRSFRKSGPKSLQGLLSEPVLTSTGFCGVVTILSDDAGTFWSKGEVTPGTRVEQVRSAYNGAAGFGTMSISHRALARSGISASGLSESSDGRLGGGSSVQAARGLARSWFEEPLAALWRIPLEVQVRRAVEAAAGGRAGPGDSLLFLDITVLGVEKSVLVVRDVSSGILRTGTSEGATSLGSLDDLRLLGSTPGLPLRVVGRLDSRRGRTLTLLAWGPRPGDSDVDSPARLEFPPGWSGRAFPGLDRLSKAMITPGAGGRGSDEQMGLRVLTDSGVVEKPSDRATRWLGRVAVHGRAPLLASSGRLGQDAAAMTRLASAHGADLLRELSAAAGAGDRRFDGSLSRSVEPLAVAWLQLATYEAAVNTHLAAQAWA